MVKDGDTLHLGPKFEQNQWEDLLAKYWLLFFIIILLLVFIILIPFIAVCYCCLCCCRRCKQGCPPCTASTDFRRRCFCEIFLFLLILCLIFGLVLALVANKLLDRGFEDATKEMRRGTEDTCKYLSDVADHIYHIMVFNYEELETHLIYQLE
ncbi:prominin-like protein [Drosophila ananassae]|nr:prominin-like protein [Drosophila ananassae]